MKQYFLLELNIGQSEKDFMEETFMKFNHDK